jgi:ribosome-associated heat shock protein Hsp15
MTDTREGRRIADPAEERRIRLDKWLWAARFFKTRALATEAVTGGRVHVGGQRVKPSRAIHLGEILCIQRDSSEYTVIIRALSDRRGPAKEAVLLYEETAESHQQREERAEQHRLQAMTSLRSEGRPTKQDRRRILHFIRNEE